VVGSGTGGFSKEKALKIMLDELGHLESNADVVIVEYDKNKKG
jgi:hypothetical protein